MLPQGQVKDDQKLENENGVYGQESSRKNVMDEPGFPSLSTVVEPRFPHGHSVVKQGLLHEIMVAEQELLHQGSTVEYGLLASHVTGSMDEYIQCLEEGDGLAPCCSLPASSINSKHYGNTSIVNLA